MLTPPPTPSHLDIDVVDKFFAVGRNLWPDIDEIRKLPFDRSKFSDEVIRFLKSDLVSTSTARCTTPRATTTGLRRGLQARHLVDDLGRRGVPALPRPAQDACAPSARTSSPQHVRRAWRTATSTRRGTTQYLEEVRDRSEDGHLGLLQAIYGVLQEYSAVIAYTVGGRVDRRPRELPQA